MKELIKELGLPEDASWSDVKQMYFEQLKLWHPDRFSADESMRKKGEERTKIVNRAFNQLKDIVAQLEEDGLTIDINESLTAQSDEAAKPRYVEEPILEKSVLEKKRNYRQESMVGLKKVENKFGQSVKQPWQVFENVPKFKLAAGAGLATVALFGIVAVIGFAGFGSTYKVKRLSTNKVTMKAVAQNLKKTNFKKDRLKENVIGSSEKVATAVGNKRSLNSPAITLAASRCSKRGVQKQLSKGVGVNTEDDNGLTALSWAAKRNCGELAKYLISKGASTKHVSLNGFTPLALAKRLKNIDVVKIIELDAAIIKKHAAKKLRGRF